MAQQEKAPVAKPDEPEFTLQDPQGGRKEPIPASFSLTPTCTSWHLDIHACVHACTHVHTHTK